MCLCPQHRGSFGAMHAVTAGNKTQRSLLKCGLSGPPHRVVTPASFGSNYPDRLRILASSQVGTLTTLRSRWTRSTFSPNTKGRGNGGHTRHASQGRGPNGCLHRRSNRHAAEQGKVGDHIKLGTCLAPTETTTTNTREHVVKTLDGRCVGQPLSRIHHHWWHRLVLRVDWQRFTTVVRTRVESAQSPRESGPRWATSCRIWIAPRVSFPRRSNSWNLRLAAAKQSSTLDCSAA